MKLISQLHSGAQRRMPWLDHLSLSSLDEIQLGAYYSTTSRSLAESLYSRAWLYLIAGCVIASIGLLFFYFAGGTEEIGELFAGSQSYDNADQGDFTTKDFVAIIRSFGVLFFIELIAFFFLRQYRAAMDDFRYFERIQRRREELVVAMKIGTADKDFMRNLVQSETIFSTVEPGARAATEAGAWRPEKHELDFIMELVDRILQKRSEVDGPAQKSEHP